MNILAALLLLLSPPNGIIHYGEEIVSSEEMLEMLDDAPVVFVGEKHDDPLAHEWELFIWTNIASENRSLALEMFETDVQDILDDYAAGELGLDEFLESAGPWSNYTQDYSPMVEFAVQNDFDIIAANVPRHFAADVARGGWQGLRETDGSDFFDSISVDSTNDFYRQRFLETMQAVGNQMQAMPVDPLNMYRAQLLKDAVMASSIRGIRCMFVCGGFHSDYHSGIPDQLDSDVSYLTVSVVAEDESWETDQADFVIVREILF